MKQAFDFFDPIEHKKMATELAKQQYRVACEVAGANNGGVPRPDEVYPELFQFACGGKKLISPFEFDDPSKEIEFYTEAVRQTAEKVLEDAPHIADALIEDKEVEFAQNYQFTMPLYGYTYNGQNMFGVDNKYAGKGMREREASPSEQDSLRKKNNHDKGQKRDAAYDISQVLMSRIKVKIIGEVIYAYNGRYYEHLTPENLRRLIMKYCRPAIEEEGNTRLVESIFKLLLCEPSISEKYESFSRKHISFKNGVLDLDSFQLYPHNDKYNTFYSVEASFSTLNRGNHPNFDTMLNQISGFDPEICQRLWEIIGYCLSCDTHGKFFFVFQGVGDSGKSVLAAILQDLLSKDASISLDIHSLGERFSVAQLVGKQLCTSLDIPRSPMDSRTVSLIKTLTGGDPVTADVKFQPHVTFYNRAKFVVATNHPLLTKLDDEAFYRRAIAVPFRFSIPREQQVYNLKELILQERDAIVTEAIFAYDALRRRNYRFSGDYVLNSMFEEPRCVHSIEDYMAIFAESCVVYEEGAYEFVEDISALFAKLYPNAIIPANRFRQYEMTSNL